MTVRSERVNRSILRAIGYRRVSTSEQADSGAGLDAQLVTLTAEAQRRGWDMEVVTDAGWSARTLDRPGLASALERLDAGLVDVLVVSKLDRLSRSMHDFSGLLERSRRHGWSIDCLDLGVDTSNPIREFFANIVAATAAYERQLIGQRTKDGMDARRAAGVHTGRRSTLPTKVRDRITAARENGDSLGVIAAGLNGDQVPTGQGGAHWYRSTVKAVLDSLATVTSQAAVGPKAGRSSSSTSDSTSRPQTGD